jgi:hypothetical protein
MLNFIMGCVLAPRLKKEKQRKKEKRKKRIPLNLGSQFCNPSWGQCWSIE